MVVESKVRINTKKRKQYSVVEEYYIYDIIFLELLFPT